MKYKCLEKLVHQKEKKSSRLIRFFNKILMAIFLGLVFLIVMEYSPKFKNFMHEDVLNKNISFGFLGKLYNQYFGKIFPNNEEKTLEVFNEKINYQNKEKYGDGWKLTVSDNYLVPSINNGIVVFIGEKEGIGKVITIEQDDGITLTYGNISNSNLKLYDYVIKGKFLGEVNGTTLYLTILKDNQYLDVETYLS